MDNNEIFETVIKSKLFNKYEKKLNEDDFNDLLNDITYFVDINSNKFYTN